MASQGARRASGPTRLLAITAAGVAALAVVVAAYVLAWEVSASENKGILTSSVGLRVGSVLFPFAAFMCSGVAVWSAFGWYSGYGAARKYCLAMAGATGALMGYSLTFLIAVGSAT